MLNTFLTVKVTPPPPPHPMISLKKWLRSITNNTTLLNAFVLFALPVMVMVVEMMIQLVVDVTAMVLRNVKIAKI